MSGNLLLLDSPGFNPTILLRRADCGDHRCPHRRASMLLWISPTSKYPSLDRNSKEYEAALLTVFLGPFGFLVAIAAVIGESWLVVKLLVDSFLIKGMIGEEVFEAVTVTHSKNKSLTLDPPTTFKRFYLGPQVEHWRTPQPRRSSNQGRPVLPTHRNSTIHPYPLTSFRPLHWLAVIHLPQRGDNGEIVRVAILEARKGVDDECCEATNCG